MKTAITAGVLALALAGGCANTPPPSPLLPTLASDTGGCRGIGLAATIAGSPSDARVAWLSVDGQRRDVVWPTGFSARFAPRLEILDAFGTVVFREGDQIDGACTGPGDLLVVRPGS